MQLVPLLFALTPYQNTARTMYEQGVVKEGHMIGLYMEHLHDIDPHEEYVYVEVLLPA